MPIRELRQHPTDYLVLVGGVIIILFGLAASWPHEHWQRLFILALGGFYSVWGIWHHARTKSLHPSIILEYLGLSVVVTAILWFALSY